MNESETCPTHHISEAFIPSSEISKSQEDAPQLKSTEVAKGCGPGVEESSSASEYFSCVSTPRKLIHGGKGAGFLGCGAPWVHGRRYIGPSLRFTGNPGQLEVVRALQRSLGRMAELLGERGSELIVGECES